MSDTYRREEVLHLVQERLAEIMEMPVSKIAESASFSDDLGADSLALIELAEAIESEVRTRVPDFRIEDDDLEDLRTVRDAVDYVSGKVGAEQ